MLRLEETEMAELPGAGIRWRDGQDLRRYRGKAGAQQFHGRTGRPRIVGHAQRAQGPFVIREILQRLEARLAEEIALARDPFQPFEEYALWQVMAESGPAGRITQHARQWPAGEI